MKNIVKIIGIILIALSVIGLTSCEDADDSWLRRDTRPKFNSLTANGSSGQLTDMLTLVFSTAVVGLTADDITLSGLPAAGVTKGALVRTAPGTYNLPLA